MLVDGRSQKEPKRPIGPVWQARGTICGIIVKVVLIRRWTVGRSQEQLPSAMRCGSCGKAINLNVWLTQQDFCVCFSLFEFVCQMHRAHDNGKSEYPTEPFSNDCSEESHENHPEESVPWCLMCFWQSQLYGFRTRINNTQFMELLVAWGISKALLRFVAYER